MPTTATAIPAMNATTPAAAQSGALPTIPSNFAVQEVGRIRRTPVPRRSHNSQGKGMNAPANVPAIFLILIRSTIFCIR